MPSFNDHRIRKPYPRSRGLTRNRNLQQSLNINTSQRDDKFKTNIFAHAHFSPTQPSQPIWKQEDAWLHVEQKDSVSVLMSSLHSAADDWECKDCSWQLRNLAAKFYTQFHSNNKGLPTSYPTEMATREPSSYRRSRRHRRRDSDAVSMRSASSVRSSASSNLGGDIAYLRRCTLTKDVGQDGQSFYGVHQAHLDLSLGETVSVHMRPTDQRRKLSELGPGTIVSAPFHSQNRDDKVSTTNYHTAVSGFGPIYSKYRKMITIEIWGDHAVCLPIYSYNGKGLENRGGMADEYMDIRDIDDDEPEDGDTHHKPLMAIRSEGWPGKNTFICGRSVVKLTEKITHHAFQKCSIEGSLTNLDFQRMYKAYLGLLQSKALEVFGKPVEAIIIPSKA
ncbi:hypothetical protein FPRO05_09672 [Fusarium proliferatum]|uniref:DUF6590 domain-containing protein n=1 Tax=Gibberella intermedia TaxID=948311 RepID=A0A365NFH3_GIBIN|nr:hypothetical protein FPRO05_09672 [Fusarium proliferatum]